MDYAEIRRVALKIFLGFLGLTAVVASRCVLASDYGQIQIKILLTTLTIAATSICAMAGAAFVEKRRHRELGFAGTSLAIVSGSLVILGVWSGFPSKEYWKLVITLVVFAVAVAHAFMLALPDLGEEHSWFQGLSFASITLLVCQIVVALWSETRDDLYYRLLAVVSIVVALETLAVPILMKLRRAQASRGRTLVLTEVEDGIYRSTVGTLYTVAEVAPGVGGT